jgi:hypothetical protein
MIFPKSMEGRYCTFLLQGIPACEVKVRHVLADEIVATYQDDAEVHINPVMLVAWWPDPKRESKSTKLKEAHKARKALKASQSLVDDTLPSEATTILTDPKDVSDHHKTKPQVKRKG